MRKNCERDVIKICRNCERELRCLIHSLKIFQNREYDHMRIANKVTNEFIWTIIFCKLNEHCNDQGHMENHIAHLIRAIAEKYIKIRMHYIGLSRLDNSCSQRHAFNKLVLFKGQ